MALDHAMMLSRCLVGIAAWALCASALVLPETIESPTQNATVSDSIPLAISVKSRMDIIKELYAWSGFVYALDVSASTDRCVEPLLTILFCVHPGMSI